MYSEFFESRKKFIRESILINIVLDDDLLFFIMFFVEKYCQDICGYFEQKGTGRPRYPIKNMIGLLLYSYCNKVMSPNDIEDNVRNKFPCMLLMDGLMPSSRSIARYRFILGCYYKAILSKTLQMAIDLGLTDLDHVAIDGTIIKAYNSNFNVIRKTDVNRLIKILETDNYDEKIIQKLRKPAYKLLNDDMKLKEKLDFLYHLREELKKSGQKTIALYDSEARWMLNKKGKEEISYNLQTAVDYTSKLILAVHVSNHPTDHYQLPPTLVKAIQNSPIPLNKISADTGYHNEVSSEILQKYELDGYIPNRKQTKEHKKKYNSNPFHKDNMIEIEGTNAFLCFNNELLTFKYHHIVNNKNQKKKGDPYEIKRIYNNPEACYICPYQKLCFTDSHTHRQITEYGSEYTQQMKYKLETTEGKEEYKKRSKTVEAPFGTLKRQYHINKLPFIKKQNIENIINLYSTVYNIKRIYKIIELELDENEEYQTFKQKNNTKIPNIKKIGTKLNKSPPQTINFFLQTQSRTLKYITMLIIYT